MDEAGGSEPSIQHLSKHCPLLDSTLRETLRVYTSSASVRLVLADTTINGKVLLRGHKVMIPYRQLHENPTIWGPDAGSFDPHRFMANRALLRDASYRPFGGGATLCAGRFVAMAEVVSFIGTVLYRYDIALSKPQSTFPKADTMKPTFGMMSPREGEDLTILLSSRILPSSVEQDRVGEDAGTGARGDTTDADNTTRERSRLSPGKHVFIT